MDKQICVEVAAEICAALGLQYCRLCTLDVHCLQQFV